MDKLNPDHVAWSANIFRALSEGSVWGIPRSGLLFTKRGERLELTERMPHDPAMPITAEQLDEQQQSDFDGVKRHFEAAGVPVVDTTNRKGTTMTSYAPAVVGVGETKFTTNGLRFATAAEALAYAEVLQGRWMGCKGGAENRRAEPSDDPVQHRWVNGKLVSI